MVVSAIPKAPKHQKKVNVKNSRYNARQKEMRMRAQPQIYCQSVVEVVHHKRNHPRDSTRRTALGDLLLGMCR